MVGYRGCVCLSFRCARQLTLIKYTRGLSFEAPIKQQQQQQQQQRRRSFCLHEFLCVRFPVACRFTF